MPLDDAWYVLKQGNSGFKDIREQYAAQNNQPAMVTCPTCGGGGQIPQHPKQPQPRPRPQPSPPHPGIRDIRDLRRDDIYAQQERLAREKMGLAQPR